MVMTVHKLSVSDGYRYLSRQVASGDTARGQGEDLSQYYLATGSQPGRWQGAGCTDLGISGNVTEAQMQALFKHGAHPDRLRIVAERVAAGVPAAAAEDATLLGRRFMSSPAGSRKAIAGYDLVFTPVKSVSLLWALGGDAARLEVEAAHHEAIANVLAWLEADATFSRVGPKSGQRVAVRGLICAAFDHRDSRAGDPNLHTHVAVSNKVRAVADSSAAQPRWLALDASVLRAARITAAERYTTRVEDRLGARLGVEFAPRSDTGREGKQVIREIVGVPEQLIWAFSKRRARIKDRSDELLSDYRTRNGRRAQASMEASLAQLATLATRPDKLPPRTLRSQIDDWTSRAIQASGSAAVESIAKAVGRSPAGLNHADVATDAHARAAIESLEARRGTWTRWNLVAEVERQTRELRPASADQRDRIVAAVTDRALGLDVTVRLQSGALDPQRDGYEHVTGRAGPVDRARYTTSRLLDAERQLVAAAREPVRVMLSSSASAATIASYQNQPGHRLDQDGEDFAVALTSTGRRLVAGIGRAGSERTSAVRAACHAWDTAGVRVIPLATSTASAGVLSAELGRRAENLHSFLDLIDRPPGKDPDFHHLGAGDVVLVHEAGLAGTMHLARLVARARVAGAGIRLLADPAELTAVESGAAIRLIASEVGGPWIRSQQFADPAEAEATLGLRAHDPASLDFYIDNGRLASGSHPVMLEAAFQGWSGDVKAGHSSLIIAATYEDARALAGRARAERVRWGAVPDRGVQLADGNRASTGDWILTGASLRNVTTHGGRDFVKDGDPWTVLAQNPDSSLTVAHQRHRGRLTLPGDYVAEHVRLAYAITIDRAREVTVDTAHPMVDRQTTPDALYLGATRGRLRNTLYVTVEQEMARQTQRGSHPPQTAVRFLAELISRDRRNHDPASGRLPRPDTLIDRVHCGAARAPQARDIRPERT